MPIYTFSMAALEAFSAAFDDEEEVVFEQPMQLLMTNMGMIPFGGMNNTPPIGKIFNFWTGHTSFSISGPIAAQMEGIEGVEVLDIYTRYRFRVGVGKLFRGNEVMSSVQRTVRNNVE